MHDQVDYFLGGQRSNSYLSSERNAQIVYRWLILPALFQYITYKHHNTLIGALNAVFHLKSNLYSSRHYSKPIKPSTSSNKPLPFIKVIEIKSWTSWADELIRYRWEGLRSTNRLLDADWSERFRCACWTSETTTTKPNNTEGKKGVGGNYQHTYKHTHLCVCAYA